MSHSNSDVTHTFDEVKRFKQDGYTVIRDFLGNNRLDDVNKGINDLISNRLSEIPREHVFYEDIADPQSLKQIQHLDRYAPVLREPFHHGVFKELAEKLLEQRVVGRNLQYFNKPPSKSLPTPPHQDGYYFKLSPPHALTMWLALDAVNEINGCVMYLPGSHHLGLREHEKTDTLGFSQGIPKYPSTAEKAMEVAILAKPGDLLVHHALTIHRAGHNDSEHQDRRALGFIYYGEKAVENQHQAKAYQSGLVDQLRDEGRI
ncbi:MAG: phytanoyl-CoA dioxygenase family protein [Rubripirellula sp.]|nr:phytanoyl-CoA dioxygenase family protein [Rubripirellula sp.]